MSAAPSSPPERPDRRVVLVSSLVALPLWLAGCGGGSSEEHPGADTRTVGAAGMPGTTATTARLQRPSVALLGRVPLTLGASDAPPATAALWIVVNAGTDARALAVFGGDTSLAERFELTADPLQGTVLRLQSSHPVTSVHVARAGQAAYALTGAALLSGAGVCRWDFAAVRAVTALEIAWTPGVAGAGAVSRVEALGVAG